MTPTKHHLTLWARRNAPSWSNKIEIKQLRGWLSRTPVENSEIHAIINERAGIKVSEFYRVANAINLYGLARQNGLREKGKFILADYVKEMFGGGSDEHKKHFSRWVRKIENKA